MVHSESLGPWLWPDYAAQIEDLKILAIIEQANYYCTSAFLNYLVTVRVRAIRRAVDSKNAVAANFHIMSLSRIFIFLNAGLIPVMLM